MSPNLHHLLTHLSNLIKIRLKEHFGQHTGPALQPPVVLEDDSPFTQFVRHRRLNYDEYVTLACALASHLQPSFYDNLMQEFLPQGGEFPAFGGVKGQNFRGFLPTGETVLFLLAGDGLERRLAVQRVFGAQHFFSKERILYLEEMKPGEPAASGRLILDPEYVELFTLGYVTAPKMSLHFPAQRIETDLTWDDLVLNDQTARQLQEVSTWIEHNDTLLYDWKMMRRLKPGFRALFYGPPGTGKTMAAGLVGKQTGHHVYRVDLSHMVSKYIGETEKNLATLFERAENKKWILFFDEADALFGKRTNVRDAHDRFANQEVSYLLQRIEDFPGLSILASNFRSNMDDAFTRRFQSVIYFPMPRPAERLQIWQKAFPTAVRLAPEIDLAAIAQKYEVSGSNIVNIVHYCCLQALAADSNIITLENLTAGITREFVKENKAV